MGNETIVQRLSLYSCVLRSWVYALKDIRLIFLWNNYKNETLSCPTLRTKEAHQGNDDWRMKEATKSLNGSTFHRQKQRDWI